VSFDAARLYALLPAVYRIRDIAQAERLAGLLEPAEEARLRLLRTAIPLSRKEQKELEELEARRQRGPLKALLAIVAEQTSVLEENLEQLYDDLFIETCAEWVVPYIGDLVGARPLQPFPGARFTERAFVANTIAYRRRKGTAAMLEQLAADVAGWSASAVEYFERLATTQYLNHLRPANLAVANIRDAAALEPIGTAFDRIPRFADVRRIERRRGRHNIPNVGVFLFRIESFPVTNAPAFQLDALRYRFDAVGRDMPLFNKPEPEELITSLATPQNVPLPLSRRVLHGGKELYYGLTPDGNDDKGILIWRDNAIVEPDDIVICDLSDFSGGWAHMPSDKVAIDPVLGRIAFPANAPPPMTVRVTYRYGFSAEMGGGEYGRDTTFGGVADRKVPADAATIQQALAQVPNGGVVEITANEYFLESPAIAAGTFQGTTIELRAAEERRPVLVLAGGPAGALTITGGDGAEVTINGLLVSGGAVRIPLADAAGNPNKLRILRLRHCTFTPGPTAAIGNATAQPAGPRLVVELPGVEVAIDRCIIGPIRAVDGARVCITDSIVDAGSESAGAYSGLGGDDAGAPLTVEDTTIIGTVHTSVMELASNTIFFAAPDPAAPPVPAVRASRLQEGCVRFSYVPPGARLPRLYNCQPASPAIAARVRPSFTSLRFGDPGYAQLAVDCPVEIRGGADDGAEMGAFHDLFQPQRESNLRTGLDEYLRFGLETGIFFAS
jgi:hypothetical protein